LLPLLHRRVAQGPTGSKLPTRESGSKLPHFKAGRRRLSTREFRFKTAQKVGSWPLFWVHLHSKTSSFFAFQNVKSFACNICLSSFPRKSIFFPFPGFSPLPRPFHIPLPRLPVDLATIPMRGQDGRATAGGTPALPALDLIAFIFNNIAASSI